MIIDYDHRLLLQMNATSSSTPSPSQTFSPCMLPSCNATISSAMTAGSADTISIAIIIGICEALAACVLCCLVCCVWFRLRKLRRDKKQSEASTISTKPLITTKDGLPYLLNSSVENRSLGSEDHPLSSVETSAGPGALEGAATHNSGQVHSGTLHLIPLRNHYHAHTEGSIVLVTSTPPSELMTWTAAPVAQSHIDGIMSPHQEGAAAPRASVVVRASDAEPLPSTTILVNGEILSDITPVPHCDTHTPLFEATSTEIVPQYSNIAIEDRPQALPVDALPASSNAQRVSEADSGVVLRTLQSAAVSPDTVLQSVEMPITIPALDYNQATQCNSKSAVKHDIAEPVVIPIDQTLHVAPVMSAMISSDVSSPCATERVSHLGKGTSAWRPAGVSKVDGVGLPGWSARVARLHEVLKTARRAPDATAIDGGVVSACGPQHILDDLLQATESGAPSQVDEAACESCQPREHQGIVTSTLSPLFRSASARSVGLSSRRTRHVPQAAPDAVAQPVLVAVGEASPISLLRHKLHAASQRAVAQGSASPMQFPLRSPRTPQRAQSIVNHEPRATPAIHTPLLQTVVTGTDLVSSSSSDLRSGVRPHTVVAVGQLHKPASMPLLIQRHAPTTTESRSGVSRGVLTLTTSAGAHHSSNTSSSTLLSGTGRLVF